MRLIDDKITLEIFNQYKHELFLFNEEYEMIKDKHVIRLYDDNKLVSIAMYSKLDKEDIELYLNQDQQKEIGQALVMGTYIDSIYSLVKRKHYAQYILNYLIGKIKDSCLWLYSAVDALSYWKNSIFKDCGENIFMYNC